MIHVLINRYMHPIYIKDYAVNKNSPKAVLDMWYLCRLHAEVLTQILMVKAKLD